TASKVSLAEAAIGVRLYLSLHLQQLGNSHHPLLGFYAVDWLFVQKAMLRCMLVILIKRFTRSAVVATTPAFTQAAVTIGDDEFWQLLYSR
ncbi:hypothetical protein, partial [Pseudoalteromonas ruthenica]|uniref:hypothetical protein n=1 Tax=Pseudoalteromonas ruthenica TaxID=151081 RepID=UPI0012733CD3